MLAKIDRVVTRPQGNAPLRRGSGNGCQVNKLIGLFLVLLMAVQLLYPLGLPGLKRRRDFWKLALLAFVLWSIVLLVRP